MHEHATVPRRQRVPRTGEGHVSEVRLESSFA